MKQKRMIRNTAPLITPCASGLKGRQGRDSARPAPLRGGCRSGGQRYSHRLPGGLVEVRTEEPRGEEAVLEGRDQRQRGHEAQQRPAEVDEQGHGGPGRHGRGGRFPSQGHGAAPGSPTPPAGGFQADATGQVPDTPATFGP